MVARLTELGALRHGLDPDHATDLVVVLFGHDVFHSLVSEAGWNVVAYKAWLYFVGRKPSTTTLDSLARTYRNAGLNNRNLVTAILEDPRFLSSRFSRPRYPVEWVVAAMAAMGLGSKQLMLDTLWGLGQVPFYPPNVAGWPSGDRWVSPSLALAKAA